MLDFFSPRSVGQTDLSVSPLGFGAAWVSGPDTSAVDAIATVKAVWDSGVRLYDTAPWYGIGRSERRLGLALAELDQPRESYAINTKVGRSLDPEPVSDPSKVTRASDGTQRTPRDSSSGFRVRFEYSYDEIKRQHRESLQRLGTARVDSLTLHDIDYGYHSTDDQLSAVMDQLSNGGGSSALAELKSTGDIRAVGLGCNLETRNAYSWEDSRHEDLVERLFDVVQLDFLIVAGGYTLLETRALRRILPMCAQRNTSVIIASPFAGGWLVNPAKAGYMYGRMSGAEPPDRIKDLTTRMTLLCDQFNVPIGAVALQFVLSHPVVAAAIPGSASPTEANINRDFLDCAIPADFWTQLKEQELLDTDTPTPH